MFLSSSVVGGRFTVKLSWIFLRSGSEGCWLRHSEEIAHRTLGLATAARLALGILIVRKADRDFLIVRRNTEDHKHSGSQGNISHV